MRIHISSLILGLAALVHSDYSHALECGSKHTVEVSPRTASVGEEITIITWGVHFHQLTSISFGDTSATSYHIDGVGTEPHLNQKYTRIKATVPYYSEGSHSVLIEGADSSGSLLTRENIVSPKIDSNYTLNGFPKSVTPGQTFKFILWGIQLTSLDYVRLAGIDCTNIRIDGSSSTYTRIEVTAPSVPQSVIAPRGLKVRGYAGNTPLVVEEKHSPHLRTPTWVEWGTIGNSLQFEVFQNASGAEAALFYDSHGSLVYRTKDVQAGLIHAQLAPAAGTHPKATQNYVAHLQGNGLNLFKQGASSLPTLEQYATPTVIATDASSDFLLLEDSNQIPYVIYRTTQNALKIASCSPGSPPTAGNIQVYCPNPTVLATIAQSISGSPFATMNSNNQITVAYYSVAGDIAMSRIRVPFFSSQQVNISPPMGSISTAGGSLGLATQPNGNLFLAAADTVGNIQYGEISPNVSNIQLRLMPAEVSRLRVDPSNGDMTPGVSLAVDELGRVGIFARDSDGLIWSTWQKTSNQSNYWSPWASQCLQSEGLPQFLGNASASLSIFTPTSETNGYTINKQQCGARCRGEKAQIVHLPNYHGIHQHRANIVGKGTVGLFLTTSNFEDHLDFYLAEGMTPVTFRELNYLCDIDRPLIITIDDGLEGIQSAESALIARDIPGVSFVIQNRGSDVRHISTATIAEMATRDGFIFQNHTASHSSCVVSPDVYCPQPGEDPTENLSRYKGLRTHSEQLIRTEMSTTNTYLDLLGQRNSMERCLAYPFGSFSNRTENIIDDYVSYAAVLNSRTDRPNNPHIYDHRLHTVSRFQIVRNYISFCDSPSALKENRLNYCAHSEYEVGPKLDSNCGGGCVAEICSISPSCCSSSWDSSCVSSAKATCDIGHIDLAP